MKKVLLVARIGKFFSDFEINNIKILQSLGYEVVCAGNFEEDPHKLDALGVTKVHFEFVTNPLAISNIKAYRKLCRYMKENDIALVHCHMPVGGVYGRLAAHHAKIHPVIYTAHGFHFVNGGPIIDWILFYPVEKICSRYTDLLVTINHEDYEISKQFHMKERLFLPGVGVDTGKFAKAKSRRQEICGRLGIEGESILLLSVGELRPRKNHEAVMEAMSDLNRENVHYLVCGTGKYRENLEQKAKDLGLQDRVHLLGYCDNIAEICKSCDVFCFPSKREGLPVAMMEAMAAGKPIVCTDIRGNHDLLDSAGGYMYSLSDADGLRRCLAKILEERERWCEMGQHNQEVVKQYDCENVNAIMEKTYRKQLHLSESKTSYEPKTDYDSSTGV